MPKSTFKPTSTQIGTFGEYQFASHLMICSKGRLVPFLPFADDDGIDLLVFDKLSRKSVPVQVKTRTRMDNMQSQTVQFDVRCATLNLSDDGFVLALLFNDTDLTCGWLLSKPELIRLGRKKADKITIVASAKPSSNDRFVRCRHRSFGEVTNSLTGISFGTSK